MFDVRFFIVFLIGFSSLYADITLHPLFSDHAVLQKSAKVPIWGKAEPGEHITVELDAARAEVVAGADGKWQAILDLSALDQGPFTLEVSGKNKLTVSDVLVGSVWITSGQSNMGWPLAKTTGAEKEIAVSANPLLRWFAVKHAASKVPLDSLEGQWVAASPKTAGYFTAVGYYFGKTLQNELQTPVGLINATWGGTPSEAWTSADALHTDPQLREGSTQIHADLEAYPEKLKNYSTELRKWEVRHGRQDPDSTPPPAEGWSLLILPANFPGGGAVWLRCSVPVSAAQVGRNLLLSLRSVRGVDRVSWNGVPVGESSLEEAIRESNRSYMIPASLVTGDEATLAIRIFDSAYDRSIQVDKTVLGGDLLPDNVKWEVAVESVLPDLSDEIREDLPALIGPAPQPDQVAGYIFNGMIHPILPYAIEGVVWYQGESNAARAHQYRTAFPLLISDWRSRWNQGDFPFYFCQLPNFHVKFPNPGESAWAELRESQTLTLSLPNTGQAVLIDVGEQDDIHPRDKKNVGKRLSAIALANHYGHQLVFSGPTFQSVEFTDGLAIISFSNTDGGLVAKELPTTYHPKSTSPQTLPLQLGSPDSQLQGFAICGKDRKWGWADARIDGDRVIVSSPNVPDPIAVRYAWSNNPTVNLYNGSGLPAAPFRTDDFPPTTMNVLY